MPRKDLPGFRNQVFFGQRSEFEDEEVYWIFFYDEAHSNILSVWSIREKRKNKKIPFDLWKEIENLRVAIAIVRERRTDLYIFSPVDPYCVSVNKSLFYVWVL